MEYEVRASNYPNFLMAKGFYGNYGKAKAQKMIDEGYWHKLVMPEFKDAIFEVVEVKPVVKTLLPKSKKQKSI